MGCRKPKRILYGFSNRDILSAIWIGFFGGCGFMGIVFLVAYYLFYPSGA